jgi:hypothetical protein
MFSELGVVSLCKGSFEQKSYTAAAAALLCRLLCVVPYLYDLKVVGLEYLDNGSDCRDESDRLA